MIKALLIDDDLKLAELLENYLRKSDIKLEAISDPLDTLPAIRNHNPEAVSYTHLTLPTTPYV